MDGYSIAKNMCGTAFGDLAPWVKHGCIKLVQEKPQVVFGGMAGNRAFGERANVFTHRRSACVDAGACKPELPYLKDTLDEATPCGACRAVVRDVEAEVALFNKPTRAQVAGVVERVCERAPYRHASPAFVQEYCADLIDDAQGTSLTDDRGSLVGTIVLRQRLMNSGMRPSDKLEDRVCSDYTSYCDKSPEAHEEL